LNIGPYRRHELLTGRIQYPVLGYTGYGDGIGTDLTAFITDQMRADWCCAAAGNAATPATAEGGAANDKNDEMKSANAAIFSSFSTSRAPKAAGLSADC
jgi:hypothetical protein